MPVKITHKLTTMSILGENINIMFVHDFNFWEKENRE
jgi:hypothetical protein